MTNYEALSDEELLARHRKGDARAEDALYARYKQIVRSRARMYFLIGADREDIIQEGMIGLYKAVLDYQPERQASFRPFAELCISRQVISAIKRATRKKHVPLNTYISFQHSAPEGGSKRPLIDVLTSSRITDPEEVLLGRESYAAVADSIEHSLSRLEHNALGLYLYGYSYQQIAEALQISTKSVDNAIQRVKKKLEARLSELK